MNSDDWHPGGWAGIGDGRGYTSSALPVNDSDCLVSAEAYTEHE